MNINGELVSNIDPIEKSVLLQYEDGLAIMSFNTDRGNMMHEGFFIDLANAVDAVVDNNQLKGLVLQGKGRHFSSGANIDELLQLVASERSTKIPNSSAEEWMQKNVITFRKLYQLKIPVVAVVKGVCLGSGLELALHCHFRLCSKEALFGLPESTFGLIPGIGGIQHLQRLSGSAAALALSLEGRHLSAQEAKDYQLVDTVFPKKDLMKKAKELISLASTDYRTYKRNEYILEIQE